MNETPNLVRIASLIGDNARAEVLSALMAGRALTATELANVAGVTKQTISSHLGKLMDGGLLAYEQQGRHRYFRLANPEIAHLLEAMMGVAQETGAANHRIGPRQPALRKARTCYDHLAGELAVVAYQALTRSAVLVEDLGELTIGPNGQQWFQRIGIDVAATADRRRTPCRSCLDWSERRHHLAGALGAMLFTRVLELGWARRVPESRVVIFSPQGETSFLALFD
jgi:DNA-binding transcriptional ArsR family regulator